LGTKQLVESAVTSFILEEHLRIKSFGKGPRFTLRHNRIAGSARGVTVVTATYDLKMMGVSDRIVYLRDGRIERKETIADIELKRVPPSED